MENSLLVTLSRQITLQRKMNVIANNMANMNTAGFKSDEIKFEEYLMPVAKVTGFQPGDKQVSYVYDPHMIRNLSEGATRQTGHELDVALAGPGWLVVNTPAGERYTRNGQLKTNNDGTLVTNEGYTVLGESGAITFDSSEKNIVIGKDGTISTDQGIKDRLRMVEFKNPQAMTKQGSSFYTSDEVATPAEKTKIIQGSFESSNVQPMKELSMMIETVRAYSGISKMLEATDKIRGQAISQLGRLEN